MRASSCCSRGLFRESASRAPDRATPSTVRPELYPYLPLLDTERHERACSSPFDKGGLGGISFSMLAYKPQLKPLARRLRAAMTDAEHRLWFRLRRKQLLGVQF